MAAFFPTLVLILAVVVAAIPWGLPEPATFILPLTLITLVFLLSLRAQGSVPAWGAFLAGLILDVLTAGPLGYWALIFLLVHTLSLVSLNFRAAAGFGYLWLSFSVIALLTSVTGWAVGSLYFVSFLDWRPMVIGALAAIALFPVLATPMRRSLGLSRRAVFGWRK